MYSFSFARVRGAGLPLGLGGAAHLRLAAAEELGAEKADSDALGAWCTAKAAPIHEGSGPRESSSSASSSEATGADSRCGRDGRTGAITLKCLSFWRWFAPGAAASALAAAGATKSAHILAASGAHAAAAKPAHRDTPLAIALAALPGGSDRHWHDDAANSARGKKATFFSAALPRP